MTMTRVAGGRRVMLPVAVLAVLVSGCGTDRPGDGANAGGGAPSRPASAAPGRPADFPCPGESPAPRSTPDATPKPTETVRASGPAAPPTDHYAENHGFRVPLPLHGQRRCEGLAAVRRIEHALEPLRRHGDFDPARTREALTGLGYPAGKVRSYQDGPEGVGFLIDAAALCLEGAMHSGAVRADAFGGYPDHSGCDVPSGGH